MGGHAAGLPGLYARLSGAVRCLARVYRDLPTPCQLIVLGIVLLSFALSNHWGLWAVQAGVLVLLFYLRLDLSPLFITFSIPFAFAYKHLDRAIFSPTEVLTLTAAVAWLVRRGRSVPRCTSRRGWQGRETHWAVFAFVAAHLLSLRVAEDLAAALWQLRTAVLEPFLLYLLLRSQDQDKGALLALSDALVLGAVAVSGIGLYQFFFTDYVESVEGVRRILSVFDSPNHLGLFLGRVVPVSACIALFGTTRLRRIAHGLALLPLLLCLYLTFSRGAWLLGLPASLLCIGWLRGRKGTWLALAVIGLLMVTLLPFVHTARFTSLTNVQEGTSFLRLLLWRGTWEMIRAHPLWGVGSGNFVVQYPRYMLPEAWREPVIYHPHNLVLETWAMLGMPGLIALTWLLTAFFRAGLTCYRGLKGQRDSQALVLGALASMVNMLAHGLVDTGYFLADLAFVLMWSIGIVEAARRCSASGQAPEKGDRGCNEQAGAQPTWPLHHA